MGNGLVEDELTKLPGGFFEIPAMAVGLSGSVGGVFLAYAGTKETQ